MEKDLVKISTTNVASIRAAWKKGFRDWVKSSCPDIICVQETKLHPKASPGIETFILEGYHGYFFDSKKAGYAGTSIYTRFKPLSVLISIPDEEGRAITMEFDKFYLINTYVPNAGQKLERLDYKIKEWNPSFAAYINELKNSKPVIWTGDLNVAHKDIDIFEPKGHDKSAGFTPQERTWFDQFLNTGYVDIFRQLHPESREFTYFTYIGNAKARGKGWRIDYFIKYQNQISDDLIHDCFIEKGDFSDHVPCSLILKRNLFENDGIVEGEKNVRLNDNKEFHNK